MNVVDSPITQEINQIVLRQIEQSKKEKLDKNIKFDASDDSDSQLDLQLGNRNIGLYTKTGYCYSDIKSFLPQVVSLILVAIWFSDNKQQHNTSDLDQKKRAKEERQQLISDIGYLSLRMKQTIQPSYI